MCVKANNIQPITLDNEEIDIVDSFTYLGAVTDNATADIRNRIKKARAAFYKPRKICTSNQYSRNTKMKIKKKQCNISVAIWGRMLENKQERWRQT